MKCPAFAAGCASLRGCLRPWYDAEMVEQPTRPRRIVRRAVMACAVVILLPVGYVGGFLGLCFIGTTELVPNWATAPLYETVFAPLTEMYDAGEPEWLRTLANEAYRLGTSQRP